MKLRSALSACAVGILIATASAVPAYADHDNSLPDVPSINTVTVTESPGTAKDQPTENTTPAAPTETPVPAESTKLSKSPTPIVSQEPIDPKTSPAPVAPSPPADPTAPAKPTVPAKPTDPTSPPSPTKSTTLPAAKPPEDSGKTPLHVAPVEPHAPVAPVLPPVPEAPAELPRTSGDKELSEPPTTTAEPEVPGEQEDPYGIVTDVFGQPGAVDARLGVLGGDDAPQLRGELVAEAVPWERPEGVKPAVSLLKMTEQSQAQTSALSMALLIGGVLSLTAGALLLFWGRRAESQREDS